LRHYPSPEQPFGPLIILIRTIRLLAAACPLMFAATMRPRRVKRTCLHGRGRQ
jgi:hypothetical protein